MASTKKTVNCQIQYQHRADDSNFDILTRLNGWAEFEDSNLIDELPHFGAVVEFWQLVTVHYDVSMSQEAVESILDGTTDPTKWNEFVVKYKLNEQGWAQFKKIGRKVIPTFY